MSDVRASLGVRGRQYANGTKEMNLIFKLREAGEVSACSLYHMPRRAVRRACTGRRTPVPISR